MVKCSINIRILPTIVSGAWNQQNVRDPHLYVASLGHDSARFKEDWRVAWAPEGPAVFNTGNP